MSSPPALWSPVWCTSILDSAVPTLAGVAHALSTFVTDASGDQVSETTINDLVLDSLRNGDFAINAHQRSIPSIYTPLVAVFPKDNPAIVASLTM